MDDFATLEAKAIQARRAGSMERFAEHERLYAEFKQKLEREYFDAMVTKGPECFLHIDASHPHLERLQAELAKQGYTLNWYEVGGPYKLVSVVIFKAKRK